MRFVGLMRFLSRAAHRLFHYYSTSCLHDEHSYCQNATGLMGAKTPALCKWCDAVCRCKCHDLRE